MDSAAFLRIRPNKARKIKTQTLQLLIGIAGVIACFGAAVVLHFLYKWTGGYRPVAVFAAANESVWEHVKILVWPFLGWSAVEYYLLKPGLRRLIVAKAIGSLLIMFLTIVVFYVYSGILGHSVLWVDISSSVIWLAFAELASLRCINSPYHVDEGFIVALSVLMLIIVMLTCFTTSPPHIGLFQDPLTGLYGFESMP